ncbi:ABC transporter ATP-binding protein [Georgenia sp. SYP-B2076]|uniref:dipeptide ABC transporter ATP-binding protein n=1 Tax=Georgenia sp. SYP-B2076 TaxID=2495881 RepID=UPI00197AAAC1|nr:ABC transporter ATP-binding protein [Georgenia sp. SYP-B2076]
MTVLQVTDLDVRLPTDDGVVHAVRGLSLAVRAGEVLAVVGESGSGKTMTALAIMGLAPEGSAVTGSVRLRGEELLGAGDAALSRVRGARVAMVFQDPMAALTPVYTIGDQVVEALRAHQAMPRRAAWERAVELLDLVGIDRPRARATAFPHELSGGMRQRAVIAMAIANEPDVILADEPTSALDVTVQAQILDVLRAAQRATGAALVLITHDLGVVAGMADRVAVMYAGRIVEHGDVREIFARPRMPYTIGLLGALPRPDADGRTALATIDGQPPSPLGAGPGCSFAPRCPGAVDVCRRVEPPLAAVGAPRAAGDAPADGGWADGGSADGGSAGLHTASCHRGGELADGSLTGDALYPRPPAPHRGAPKGRLEAPEILRVTGLVRHFPLRSRGVLRRRAGTVRALDGVSLDLRAGEVLGLVGESGSGKSTLVREILELRAPAAGRLTVLGEDVAGLRGPAARAALRRDLQVVFQDPSASLDPRMPVFDLLAEPLHAHGVRGGARERRVGELMDLVGLEAAHAARFPEHLSGGQRQRVAIARALALEPRLLVLDEPVSALDVSVRAGIVNLLDELRTRLGLSYLVVSHDLSVVRHLADRVAVMHLGRIVEVGAAGTVFARPAHPYTQALLSAVPVPDPAVERWRTRVVLRGEVPAPADVDVDAVPDAGCRFRGRCPLFADLDAPEQARCATEDPSLRPVPTGRHRRTADEASLRQRGAGRLTVERERAPDQQAACHFAGQAPTP